MKATHGISLATSIALIAARSLSTLTDLAGLSADELDDKKSLVSDQFVARPQLIGDPYSRPQKALIDFSLIKPKHPIPANVVQQ